MLFTILKQQVLKPKLDLSIVSVFPERRDISSFCKLPEPFGSLFVIYSTTVVGIYQTKIPKLWALINIWYTRQVP